MADNGLGILSLIFYRSYTSNGEKKRLVEICIAITKEQTEIAVTSKFVQQKAKDALNFNIFMSWWYRYWCKENYTSVVLALFLQQGRTKITWPQLFKKKDITCDITLL